MPSEHPSSPSAPTTPARDRLVGLDVVRGLAVCGILFANIATVLKVFVPWTDMQPPLTAVAQGVLIDERFFPIFSFLFGIGFAIMVGSAARRSDRPRRVMVQRFTALAVLGALHQFLQPGEALLPYATAGLLVLLPMSYLPASWRPWGPALAGIVLMVPGAIFGGMVAIPGLFLLGTAVADAGWHRRAERSAMPGLVLAAAGAVVAVPMTAWQLSAPEQAGFSSVSSIAGLATAAVYIGLTLALLHTPLRRALVAFFAPLGRTALTSYVSASVVGAGVGAALFSTPVLGGEPVQIDQRTQLLIWAGCAVFLVIQSVVARWWLARVGQGPLERLWRALTWAGIPQASATGAATAPDQPLADDDMREPAGAERIRA